MLSDFFAYEEFAGTCEDKFIAASFDFATILSSSFCSCIFAIVLGQLIKLEFLCSANGAEMADVAQMKKIVPSRVKLPLVNVSASWGLVSMYRIWILGSRSILSNNQPKATLWVLDTCLTVGLRPFIIILITASLSSKTYNIALGPECVPFDGTWSMLVRSRLVCFVGICCRMFGGMFADKFPHDSLTSLILLVLFGEEWYISITKSQRLRARIPSMRKHASREIISAPVELCETEVCFLHIQLIGTNVWLPKMHRIPPDVVFESSKVSCKIRSLETNLVCIVVLCFPHNNIACIHLCDECKRWTAPNVCHKLLSTVWSHEQVCSQTTKYQVSQYEPNTDISEQFVSKRWRNL